MLNTAEAPARTKPPSDTDGRGGIAYVLSGRVLGRSVLIALIVGTLLTLANQSDVILRRPVHPGLWAKICFNFVIPFAVSSVSAYVNRRP